VDSPQAMQNATLTPERLAFVTRPVLSLTPQPPIKFRTPPLRLKKANVRVSSRHQRKFTFYLRRKYDLN
jgi:hypothetical protein